MPIPRLSVVVPFFNVEDYVLTCLRSLRRQTLRDLEVVLVDDGSTDDSFGKVRAAVVDDDRFRVVRQENQGPGPARNVGVEESRGEFLAFVDSDDVVPRRSLDHMVRTLQATGSDIVAGNVRRFNALGVRDSYVHREPFRATRLRTSIREFPELALDRMVWNKVYRRTYWERAGLRFPAMLYEDYPVSVAAHVRAGAVDVLQEAVYYWRERDGGEPSITQRASELDNLVDRVVSAEAVLDLLRREGPAEAVDVAAAHLLHIDVAAIAAALHVNDAEEHPRILDLALRLLDRIPDEVRRRATPFDRVQSSLLAQRRRPELQALLSYRADEGTGGRVVPRTRGMRRRHYVELPFFGTDIVPRACYQLTDPPRLHPSVLDAFWRGGRLHLDLDVGTAPTALGARALVRVWLQSPDDVRLPLNVERYERTTHHVGPELTGVRVSVDPTALPGWPSGGFWQLHVGVRSTHHHATAPVGSTAAGRARLIPPEPYPGGFVVQPCLRKKAFGLWVRRPDASVEKVAALADEIELRGWFRADRAHESADLLLLTGEDDVHSRIPVTVQPVSGPDAAASGLHEWTARVPVDPLIDHGEDFDPVEEPWQCMVRLQVGDQLRQVATGRAYPGGHLARHWRVVRATRSAIGNLVLVESHCTPRLTDLEWEDQSTLVIRGDWGGPGTLSDVLKLRTYPQPTVEVEIEIPLTHREGCFRADVDVRQLVEAARRVSGVGVDARSPKPWDLLFQLGGHLLTPVVSRDLESAMPEPRHVEGRRVWLLIDRGDVGRLMIRPD